MDGRFPFGASESFARSRSNKVSPISPSSMLRAFHLVERRVESLSNSFLHETFFQTQSKVSADDFHDVFGFEWRGPLKQLA